MPTTPKCELRYAGFGYTATPTLVLDTQWLRLRFKGSADGATLWVASATYSLPRRTAAYATVGQINNRGALPLSVSAGAGGSNPLAGSSQTGLTTGVRQAF